jgi:hypothetical protein
MRLDVSAASAPPSVKLKPRDHRPWYSLFNVASRGDVEAIQEQILTEDYESCAISASCSPG